MNTLLNGCDRMKAARLHQYGKPDGFVCEDVEIPTPKSNQVLIQVESVSVNYADLIRRRNESYPYLTPLPAILGGEVAGTVAALGEQVEGIKVGDVVFAVLPNGGMGGYAQYAIADANQTIPIPQGMTADQASTLVIAGVTALQMLRDVARLQPGESVFIPGATGGVSKPIIAGLLRCRTISRETSQSDSSPSGSLDTDPVRSNRSQNQPCFASQPGCRSTQNPRGKTIHRQNHPQTLAHLTRESEQTI